ncbi:TetR/AcrR family transcriptional regulator [Bradyrhizobium sp. KB893862 SZCCT0404]|uniref:TetR/AcrR family transcriptional regulator n=1 Tax=Bradyrhizobium sp. KB893862 SZCCT0404 TaxID=2807672 RepID=UPI001BA7D2DC|nr:TetR/AcrR family transcriptional regulator [Bradyrhizobium sp. KB893862 SZCCT0404]MBR1177145.1 TetR/AcrR family transcriptional regulator [Bradyrhizobium sp. KB893862 SZCCT0404]
MARPRTPERKDEILAAFEACVVRNGLANTTLEDIAREAGQPRSLVRYFAGNRDELTSLLIDRLVSNTETRLKDMRVRCKGSVAAFVTILFEEFYSDESANRIVVELWHLAMRSDALKTRLLKLYDGILRDIANQVSSGETKLEGQAAFDATYAVFSLGLGGAILKGIGLLPSDPLQLPRIGQGLALAAAALFESASQPKVPRRKSSDTNSNRRRDTDRRKRRTARPKRDDPDR